MFISSTNGGNKYQIERSVRLRSSNTAYFSRVPGVTGNRRMFTISAWVKLSTTTYFPLLSAGASSLSNGYTTIGLNANGSAYVVFYSTTSHVYESAALFRDPSAWYHIVYVVDTAQATGADRLKLYVNGVQVTLSVTATYTAVPQNFDCSVNTISASHLIGVMRNSGGSVALPLDGYISEYNFIDGQALTPTSFGEYSPVHGQWTAKPYLGTYGVNGFYLPFKNNLDTVKLGWDYRKNIEPQTLTGSNGAVLTTSVKKYGTAALSLGSASNKFVLYGTGTGNAVAEHNIYNRNFTLEFWYKCQASDFNFGSIDGVLSGYNYIISKGRVNTSFFGWGVHILSTGAIQLDEFRGGTSGSLATTGVNILDNQWHHIAITRSGNTTTIYFDGVSVASNASFNGNTDNSYGLVIGGMWDYTNGNAITYYAGGTIDDIRFYSGVTKYTGNFTVPSDSIPVGFDDPYWMFNVFAMPMDGTNGSSSLPMYVQNYWASTGVSLTAGSTYDSMLDVPLGGGGNERGNYATLNPLGGYLTGGPTLTDGNLNYGQGAATWNSCGATIQLSTGKWYFEAFGPVGASQIIGLGLRSVGNIGGGEYAGSTSGSYGGVLTSSQLTAYSNATTVGNITGTFSSSTPIQLAVDFDSGKVWIGSLNGTWIGGGNPASGTTPTYSFTSGTQLIPYISAYANNAYANFGQRPFAYTPPAGFKALCTANLPAVTIPNGRKHFDVRTRTGNGSSQSIADLLFQPDLDWTKARNRAGYDHYLLDSVRGGTKWLGSSSTSAEATIAQAITSFNSNGVTFGSDAGVNENTATYVDWLWKAGGAGVTNTAGSITSTVSANTTAGFSIVTRTGTGVAGTVGHGLGRPVAFRITKSRGVAAWVVYHQSLGTGKVMVLNGTNAVQTLANYWDTTPTSSVMQTGDNADVNANGVNYLDYCFAEVPGFSRIGSYTGNGSTDGPFVFCGFRPRWVLFKNSGNGTVDAGWAILDTARNTVNVIDAGLQANSAGAEAVSAGFNIDVVANGFKVRNTSIALNNNTNTIIFMAFAEAPFQYALAR